MKFNHSYQLNSDNRKVPMMMYAKGLGFEWTQLRDDIAADTFDPKNHDMLHALNWMSRHLRNYVSTTDEDGPGHNERLAAFDAWCNLYPWAPIEVQAHMVLMLQNVPKAHLDLMKQEPQRWCTALEKSWSRRDDLVMWKAIISAIPEQAKHLMLSSEKIQHALLLLRPHVHDWIKDAKLRENLSDLLYETLISRSKPALQEKIATFRLLYPNLEDLPKAAVLTSVWETNNTKDSGERMKLEHFKQLASNLVQFNTQHEAALRLTAIDLPANVFEFEP